MALKCAPYAAAIFLCVASTRAQVPPIHFDHLTPKDGLTHMVVFDILEDRDGFIWFASQLGLDRYDGSEFLNYQNTPDDSTSLSNNIVTSLLQDKEGYIWIGTNGGLNRLDPLLNTITRYKPKSIETIDIWCMTRDSTGNLWLGTLGQGLFMFEPQTGKFTHFVHEPENPRSLSHNIVRALAVDAEGSLWVGTLGGLDRLWLNPSPTVSTQSDSIRFLHYRHDPADPGTISSDAIECLYVDRDGVLWVGTSGGGINMLIGWQRSSTGAAEEETRNGSGDLPIFARFQHDPDDPHSMNSNFVTTILQDSQGRMWIGTASRGINILPPDKKKFYRYETETSDPRSLSDNFVNKIIEDRAGNIWIATQEGGVNRYSPHNKKFTQLLRKTELPEGLESNNLNAVIEDENGDLWVSFIGYGLAKYDRKRKRVIDVGSLFYQNNSALRVPIPAMCRDASGVFWLGTWGDGLRRFDPITREITFYRHDPNNPNSLSDNRIVAVYPRSDGTIWISTQSGGLNRFDPRTNTFTRFLHDPEDPTSISSNLTHSICEDRNGSLWVATLGGGLNQLIEMPASEPRDGQEQNQPMPTETKFRRFQHDPADPSSLAHNLIIALLADSRGNLWVGTGGGGLDKLDIEKGTFQHFSEANGYPFRVVTHIQEDAQGNLWVVTTKALVKFNERGVDETGRQFLLFDFTDGRGVSLLPTVPSATWRSPGGEIFLAGYDGITAFHPDQIQTNPYIPPVKITEFYVVGKPAMLDTSITVKKVITLPYKENTFSFEFAALNYVQPHKNQYAYKLEGFDKEWIHAGNRRRATYTNIDPGTYIFRVKASNNDGVWNEEGASVRIIITPPWWRTRWAYAGYVLLLGTVLYGIRRFELNRFHLRNELRRREFETRKLQEMDEMKSRFFANISHEFRTPLTLILGPLETLLSQTKDPERKQNLRLMYGNARRLQRLIDQLLDLTKLRSGRMALRVRPMNVAAFVRAVTISFASLAERRRIRLSFSGPEEGLRLYVDRDKLEKIVSNLISNAFKFTPEGGEVSVAVTPVQTEGGRGFVEISVADTGVGIAPEHLEKVFDRFYQVDDSSTRSDGGTGIGLALARELVELHCGQIWAESEPGKGATFFVRLPLGKAHLKPHEVAGEETRLHEVDEPISDDGDNGCSRREPVETPQAGAPRVLVIEDNADVRRYIRSHLQSRYCLLEAEDGPTGLDLALAEMPDVIISDVMMPGLDGFALCEKLKTDPRTSHIPVILLTARASAESKIEGLETGADDYITKPFNVKELEVRLRNLIEQRRRLRERFQRQFLLQPREVAVASADERFLSRAMQVVEAHLDDPQFSSERFAREVGLSATHLHRKLKALTGHSATEFIRMVRLKRAAYLIEKRHGNMAEIAYEVGFNSPSYFAARFRQLYGVSPREYAERCTQSAPD